MQQLLDLGVREEHAEGEGVGVAEVVNLPREYHARRTQVGSWLWFGRGSAPAYALSEAAIEPSMATATVHVGEDPKSNERARLEKARQVHLER